MEKGENVRKCKIHQQKFHPRRDKMKRKGQWHFVAALCILSLLIVASAAAGEKDVITLNLGCSSQLQRGTLDGDYAYELQRLTETYTNGRLKFKMYGIGEVHKNFVQMVLATRAGEWDACVTPQAYFGIEAGVLSGPLIQIGTDENTMVKNQQTFYSDPHGGGKLQQLIKKKGGTILYLGFAMPFGTWINTKAESLADWKKLKLRAVAGAKEFLMYTRSIGGVPVTTTAEEAPVALRTGVVDGTSTAWNFFYDQGMYSLVRLYWPRNLTPSIVGHYGMMSNKAWDRLPPDIQKILQEKVRPKMEQYTYDYFLKSCADYSQKIAAKTTAYDLSSERITEIREAFRTEQYPYYEALDPEMWGVWKKILGIK
jgi:TRAP-type C4-dicarboxylate transport system substrate-binding protein